MFQVSKKEFNTAKIDIRDDTGRSVPFEILGKQTLNVATDMIDGNSFKESAKDRLKEGIKICSSQRESIQQSVSGFRRKRRHRSQKSCKKSKKRKID